MIRAIIFLVLFLCLIAILVFMTKSIKKDLTEWNKRKIEANLEADANKLEKLELSLKIWDMEEKAPEKQAKKIAIYRKVYEERFGKEFEVPPE